MVFFNFLLFFSSIDNGVCMFAQKRRCIIAIVISCLKMKITFPKRHIPLFNAIYGAGSCTRFVKSARMNALWLCYMISPPHIFNGFHFRKCFVIWGLFLSFAYVYTPQTIWLWFWCTFGLNFRLQVTPTHTLSKSNSLRTNEQNGWLAGCWWRHKNLNTNAQN